MHRWLKALFSLVMVLQFAWAAIGLHGVYEMKAQPTAIAGDAFARLVGAVGGGSIHFIHARQTSGRPDELRPHPTSKQGR